MIGSFPLFLLLILAAPLAAQLVPNAPVEQFYVPQFDAQTGYLAWEVEGVEGRWISEEESEIVGLELRVLAGDAALTELSELRSPRAHIFWAENRAEGPSSLFVRAPNFTVEGSKWAWWRDDNRILIRERARVVFLDTLDILE